MDQWANQIFAAHPEVEELIVFGSFQTGKYAPGSDLDLFIVLSDSPKPVRERVPDFLPGGLPVPADVFPFTRAEIAERRPSALLDAVEKSDWRYARPK